MVTYKGSDELRGAGYAVVETPSGEEAIAPCKSDMAIDIVFTDINLTGGGFIQLGAGGIDMSASQVNMSLGTSIIPGRPASNARLPSSPGGMARGT